MDNRFLFKITEGGQALIPGVRIELPYPGRKLMIFVEELDIQFFGGTGPHDGP